MKVRIRGQQQLCDAKLVDNGLTMLISHTDGEEVYADPIAAYQNVIVVWATPDEKELLEKLGYV